MEDIAADIWAYNDGTVPVNNIYAFMQNNGRISAPFMNTHLRFCSEI
jgi:hypothetical protein